MRLGLVTDVHNHAVELAAALRLLRDRGVEQVITLGDTCDAFVPAEGAQEVAALLRDCGAIGVWGNHDFSLCRDVEASVGERYGQPVLEFMAGIQPRLVLAGCRFSHREASVDPHDMLQLWDLGDEPLDLVERASRAFAAAAERWQFVGHYHRWWAATPRGPVGWDGSGPLAFAPGERYFVVVAAVCEGWCGVLDTEAGCLEPLRCRHD
jgi:hypothetical protein